jgi:bifunctional DNA-binding transcriptional regulator/antitoxin component of YhaV-PrlF toxin-antitoxin module
MRSQFWCKVLASGQVLIPAVYRKAFKLSAGDDVIVTRSEYGIQIVPLHHIIDCAHEMVTRHISTNVDLVRDLRDFRAQDGRHGE